MFVNYNGQCCGLKELHGLSTHETSETAMIALGRIIYPTQEETAALIAKVRARALKDKADPYTEGYLTSPNRADDGRRNAVFADHLAYARFRFATFAEAINPQYMGKDGAEPTNYDYGRRFAALIRKEKLGDVLETGRHVNPNSNNHLKVWIWTLDHVALKAWLEKQPEYVKARDATKTAAPTVAATVIVPGPAPDQRFVAAGQYNPAPLGGNQWGGNPGQIVDVSAGNVGGNSATLAQAASLSTQTSADEQAESAFPFHRILSRRR